WQRRRSGDEQPHAPRDLARRVEEADVNRRHAEKERRPEIEELTGRGAMIESLQQPHAAAADQPAVQAVAEGVDVEEGKTEEEAIVARDLPRSEQGRRI